MLHLASAVLLAGGAHAAATATRHLHQDIGSMEGTLTAETAEFNAPTPAECTSVMAGCTGTFANGAEHNVGGMLTVIDDCTFRVTSWTFDGTGPAVEWWAEQGEGDPEMFPYDPATSLKIAEIGEPGNYVAGSDAGGSGDITVRLGKSASGQQLLLSPELNHISLWCEEFTVDFGNALLSCENAGAPSPAPAGALAPAPAMAPSPAAAEGDLPVIDGGAATDDEASATTDMDSGAGAGTGTVPPDSSGGSPASPDAPSSATHALGAAAAAAAAALFAAVL